ncbi:hypothetical protein B4U79_08846 [Dinothrombium tinctorium]|uniref:PHD-type domain-containing protein n=1 Tax=Dinothrombium tinctorium TaxID=1965070 RepID=A0A3S3Q875_9ACAR|nr:hypothetical protein B4U79_08846 [Dinothrombium tinctorium]
MEDICLDRSLRLSSGNNTHNNRDREKIGSRKMGTSQSQQCGICERTFMGIFSDDIFVLCERCGGVYCIDCAGITKTQYEMVQNSREINWYCPYCVIEIKRNYEVTWA